MEKQDVLDEKGNYTGEVKPRDQIGRDGDWHLSVHCWIINSKGELLIQKRSPEKESHPNMWDISAAGHVAAGDTPVQTVIREAKEELGLVLTEGDFKQIATVKQNKVFPGGNYFNREFNPVYILEKDIDLSELKLQKDEVSEVKWMPWREFKKKIDANDPTYVPHPDEYKKLFKYLEENK